MFRRVFLTVILTLTLPAATQAQLDLEPEELRPGLVAVYQSLVDKAAVLTRVDAKPAFFLDQSSPHPRLPPGSFEATWTGIVLIKDAGPLSFDAFVGGDLMIEIAGVTVFKGASDSPTSLVRGKDTLERKAGLYPFRLHFKSRPNVPARLQVFWQGPMFSREVLPAWQFWHHLPAAPPTLKEETLAARGKTLVARFGCARCHQDSFPGVDAPPPGPSLADLQQRVDHAWLVRWLADPAKVHADSRMPALFPPDRSGFVQRWMLADYLLGTKARPANHPPAGDHREGRKTFVGIGCFACHQVPDVPQAAEEQRWPLRGLGDRFAEPHLATFLANPAARYPDGRMPHLAFNPAQARDIAAYLLMWSPPTEAKDKLVPPSKEEIQEEIGHLKARSEAGAGLEILNAKRCGQCHPGLGSSLPVSRPAADPAQGCFTGQGRVRYALDAESKTAVAAYLKVAGREKHPSPFDQRQHALARAGCVRCHQRDTDKSPPIEAIGSTLGTAWLQNLPFQKTPRLTQAHEKYHTDYLTKAVRDGVSGLRIQRYSYRMPAFGKDADMLVRALAEADGAIPGQVHGEAPASTDPTLGSLTGPVLAGFQGYACVSCHVWNGKLFAQPDAGAVGTELTRVTGRIRRDSFERFLENPARFHPGTPMPAIFTKGKPATLAAILDGDPRKQKDALWSYFALGAGAPSPKPPPPLAVSTPAPGQAPLVAQIPVHLPDGKTVIESLTVLFASDDLLLYDLANARPVFLAGAQLLRTVEGRLRTYVASGTPVDIPSVAGFSLQGPKEVPDDMHLQSYTRLADGVRVDWLLVFPSTNLKVTDTLRLIAKERRLVREVQVQGLPKGRSFTVGDLRPLADEPGKLAGSLALPPATKATPLQRIALVNPEAKQGSLERPGYRAVLYARPKNAGGEDLLMPAALAVHPRDGRVFVASMKMGEIFVLRPDADANKKVPLEDYTRGLFQEGYALLAEEDALYVLHRRNLTKIVDTAGQAQRFERVQLLPHGVGDTYDYAYGLVKDASGAFVYTFAPHANRKLPGSGSALHLVPGQKPRASAFGFRNPLGWCVGPDREVFFSDNQGEWVATNKLCHLQEDRFFGYPNIEQKEFAKKPHAKTAIWVPYAWARSINGVAHDHTGGKFGPFAGQIFMAELMDGGGIVRANLEKINGQYQGACFPFWGAGMMGPVVLAFSPQGPLYVGSITEPGWMAQPDRGALYRLDFTGQTPFEIKSIHVLPRGFRIVFTTPVDPATGRAAASYHIEHHRYEYNGSYGSPELDRTRLPIEKVILAADGLSVDLLTAPLTQDRVYIIGAPGVRSPRNEPLVHTTGAYTLNEIPR